MSFPDVSEAIWDWTDAIDLKVLGKTIVDGEIVEKAGAELSIEGVLQPIPPRKLMVKPEGQRDWKWWTLWTTQYLEVDTVLIDVDGRQYRVMTQTDWQNAGYYEYELTEAPR